MKSRPRPVACFQRPIEPLEPRRMLSSVPLGFVDSQVTAGLTSPTAMEIAPDGRIFVTQQSGAIRVIKNGQLLTTPFATLTVNSKNERGLGGIVFDPNFASNGFVYVYYTATSPTLHNRVSRFTANGDVALAGSETVILDLPDLNGAINHMGGAMHFGADGKLYIATGNHDQTSAAPQQNPLANPFGKMLRINSDGTIPTDNPFYSQATGVMRANWAYGLRNPFTFGIQPGTGRIFINDVGQDTWEEVNEGVAGANYGWPLSEGPTSDPRFRAPLHYYPTSDGCAITGGTFYNPAVNQFPAEYVGSYFYADLCGGFIRALNTTTAQATTFATGAPMPVDIDVAADGTMYYLCRGSSLAAGTVRKVVFQSIPAPAITSQPQSQLVTTGDTATFTVAATNVQTYQWFRDGNPVGTNSPSYSIPSVTLADSGAQVYVTVSNSTGSATSDTATLTVTDNRAPTAAITSPLAGTSFRHGQTFSYSGTGSDPEDGPSLGGGAFTWQVDYITGTVVRPFIEPTSGATSGTFTIPTTSPYTATDVRYRIILTVTDSGGRTATATRDLVPQIATVTLKTSTAGLSLRLDGQPVAAPFTFQGVVGLSRNLEAPLTQVLGNKNYQFTSWSDGGAAVHNISFPAATTTYTATYRKLPGNAAAPASTSARTASTDDEESGLVEYVGL